MYSKKEQYKMENNEFKKFVSKVVSVIVSIT